MLSREQLADALKCRNNPTCKCSLYDNCCEKTGNVGLIDALAKTGLELMDQVEAQQKEIEQYNELLKKIHNKLIEVNKGLDEAPTDGHNPNDLKEIEQLKQQLRYTEGAMESEAFYVRQLRHDVEQFQSDLEECQQALCVEVSKSERLEAQNAAYREALAEIKDIELDKHFQSSAWTIANDTLSTEQIDYHNPKDIETLNKTRELLAALNYRGGLGYEAHEWIDGTLEAIDKAIGGGQ